MNKKIKKTVIIVLCAAVLLGAALSGCGKNEEPTLNSGDVIDSANTYAEEHADENPLGRREDYQITKDPNDPNVQALIGEYLATYGIQLEDENGNPIYDIDPRTINDGELAGFEQDIMRSKDENGNYTYKPKTKDYNLLFVYHNPETEEELAVNQYMTYNVDEETGEVTAELNTTKYDGTRGAYNPAGDDADIETRQLNFTPGQYAPNP